jgi:Ca2+-binding RTX toxin-like protein
MTLLVADQRFAAPDQFQAGGTGFARLLRVAPLADGGFVAAWAHDGRLVAQMFDRHGAPAGGRFPLASNPASFPDRVELAPLPGGGFVATWEVFVSSQYRVEYRRFDSAGQPLGPEQPVSAAYAQTPSIAALEGGGFVIAFTGVDGQGSVGIYARRFDSQGAATGAEFLVNTTVAGHQYYSRVAPLPGGGFLVTWLDPAALRGQILDASGQKVGGEFDIAPPGNYATNLAALPSGNVVVTYVAAGEIMAKILTPTGAVAVPEFQVNASTTGSQSLASIAVLPTGEFLITWRDYVGPAEYDPDADIKYGEVRGQLFAADGARIGEEYLVNNVTARAQTEPVSTAFGSGDVATLWIDYSGGQRWEAAIAARLFFSTRFGTEADDSLAGTPDRDFVYALGGNDSLTGADGADQLDGGDGNDTIDGGTGNDLLLAGAGNDMLTGGDGNDVLYFGSTLSAGDVADGGAGRDAIVLQGHYTTTLGDLTGLESISLQSGANTRFGDTANNFYDYDITIADGLVAAGQQLIVNAQSLRSGEDFTFDGSAESDGKFLVYGGHGIDDLTGGAGADLFVFEGARWGPDDKVDGGAGRDALVISAGSGLTRIEFGAASLANIESISLNNRYATDPSQKPSYELVLHNGNVAAGGTLIVNGSSIPAGQLVNIDGRGVHDGNLILFGGGGHDTLFGGDGNDLILGGGGADGLTGGAGADTFRYDAASDSSGGLPDLIGDFQTGLDKIDLSRIDANTHLDGDQAFSWIGSNAFGGTGAASAGELRVVQSNGQQRIEGDTNGDGVADLVIVLQVGTAPVAQGDFLP